MKHFFNYLIITAFSMNVVMAVALPSNDPSDHENQSKDTHASVSVEMFSLFMAVQSNLPSNEVKAYWNELNEFTALLEKKKTKYRSEQAFLKYLFYKVHRQYLKKYRHHTTFYHLFEDGYYNCVTGTALYAILLDAFDLNYQIRETPYHVFLVVYSSDHTDSVLLESTDPHGFIDDSKDMANAINLYQETQAEQEDPTSVYDYNFDIDESINLRKLAGLSYFNQAVDHYNQQQPHKAIQYLKQAIVLYPAKRMEAFQSLIFQTAQKANYSR